MTAYEKVDWSLQDRVIARQLYVTDAAVWKARRRRKAPKAEHHRCSTRITIKRAAAELARKKFFGFSADILLTQAEVARKLKCSHASISFWYPYVSIRNQLNWRLSNVELARIWKLSRRLVANWRCQLRKASRVKHAFTPMMGLAHSKTEQKFANRFLRARKAALKYKIKL